MGSPLGRHGVPSGDEGQGGMGGLGVPYPNRIDLSSTSEASQRKNQGFRLSFGTENQGFQLTSNSGNDVQVFLIWD